MNRNLRTPIEVAPRTCHPWPPQGPAWSSLTGDVTRCGTPKCSTSCVHVKPGRRAESCSYPRIAAFTRPPEGDQFVGRQLLGAQT